MHMMRSNYIENWGYSIVITSIYKFTIFTLFFIVLISRAEFKGALQQRVGGRAIAL